MHPSFARRFRTGIAIVLIGLCWLSRPARAANLTAVPGDDLQTKINSMNPGDTLTLAAGTYVVNNIAITKQGNASAWFTIQGAVGGSKPKLSNPGVQNMFNITGAKYVKFINLEITGGVNGEDAFKFTGTGNQDLLVQDCYMHDIGGHGISCAALSGPLQRLTVRRCEVSYTHGNAETMYLGNNNGVGTVMNSLFESNHLHHTLAGAATNQGDGLDLNKNCAGNIFRDNVIHDTYLNGFTIETGNVSPPNIFERNVCWNSTADSSFQSNGGSILRNNIFFGSAVNAANFSGSGNVVLNNVFYKSSGDAVNFGNGTNIVFANNIVDGGAHQGGTLSGTIRNNYWKSTTYGTDLITGAPGYNPSAKNFYPTQSNYLNAGWGGNSYQPADDFNTTPRTGLPDIGAYEITGPTNPGWTIVAGFKVNTPANQSPTIASPAAAAPNPVVNAATTSLSVSASDPDSGPSALTYTWSKVSGPGTVTFSPNGTTGSNLSTATFGASGSYSVRVTVSDGNASVTSTISSLTVTLPVAGTAPSITTQPANKAVTAGQTATFSVAASGSATLTYQWQKNSSNIGGATGSSYTTPATAIGDNGNTYRVIVTNGYGSVTSNQATLSVSFGVNPLTPTVSSISLPAAPGSTTLVSTTFQLTNSSGSTVTVTITDGQSWLTATPGSVSIPAGATVTFTVTGNPTGLSGVVSGSLTLTNAPGGQTQTIPVALDLSGTLPAASTGGKKSGCAVSTPGAPNGFALALLAMSVLGLLPALRRRRMA